MRQGCQHSSSISSQRRLDGVQAEDRHLRLVHRGKSGIGRSRPHLLAAEACAQCFGLPYADQVETVVPDAAVMAQLSWSA